MTVKVDETGMLHLDKITLAQKTNFHNFFVRSLLSLRSSDFSPGISFRGPPLAPKAIGVARGPASRAQSNRPVDSLNRLRSMLWACLANPLALGVNRRRWIERSMHQTCRFKRIFRCSVSRLYCIDLERRLRRGVPLRDRRAPSLSEERPRGARVRLRT